MMDGNESQGCGGRRGLNTTQSVVVELHRDRQIRCAAQLIAGGVAGGVNKTCTASLARLTILFQVLCFSALTNTEKEIVTKFENLPGVTILKNWKSMVTHVIAYTDENGACRRTLKFLMCILEGKWILSVQLIKACIEAGDLVDEQQYEILVDIHGIRDGPKLGRLRFLNKQPKLFDGQTFYFMGDFTPSYKGYLHDLVVAAEGKVLNRKPVVGDHSTLLNGSSSKTFIILQH